MRSMTGCAFLLVLVAMGGTLAPPARAEPPERYRPAVQAIQRWIASERALKKIPSLSLALVDDQTVVWSQSFGDTNPSRHEAATPETLYRVGSVSKPFTALLLMIFVEMGLIDLDVPVQVYLPEFRPVNKSGKKITLRQMLSHRSGIVREGPVGNYFDDSQPSLADTVKSLNQTELVFEPGTTTSYSNMALATAGYVLERTQKEPFAKLMQRKLLDRIGMTDSSFDPSPDQRKRIAKAVMWSYHGRAFPAPEFDFGMAPAANLFSSVNDQAKFLQFLFSGGRGPSEQVLKRETLEQMWTIQFPAKDAKAGFGLGFFVSELDGKRVIRHGGAVYGFATEFAALPDQKLGVIVCAAKDVSNAVTTRIAMGALQSMAAVRADKALPALENSKALDPLLAHSLAGRYASGTKTIDCHERDGRLWIFPYRGGVKAEVRQIGNDLITDDLHSFGLRIARAGQDLVIGKETFRRQRDEQPAPAPAKWEGLLGEYGPDHNLLVILEKDGLLHALIEWEFLYPLQEVSSNVFRFPDYGLYVGDKLTFTRDKNGEATEVDAASVLFKRRSLPRRGETFKIQSLRPIDELRTKALRAKPPVERNELFRKAELVELTALEPTIKLDVRYARANNFLGTPFYTSEKAFLQRSAAVALVRAHKKLTERGYGLLIHDAYRPWHVTKMFWDATPTKFHHFVANPAQGSRHNRGCAVDLTLFDLRTGEAIEMTGGYDEFSDRSYPDYLGGTSLQRWHRDLLRRTMEDAGFRVFEAEWWHFDFQDWRRYPILNSRFEDL